MTKVTKPALPADERYVSRSGVLQTNVAEVNRLVEANLPDHVREDQKIDRTTLDDLENNIRAMELQVTDREHSVRKLEPEVEAAEKTLERCREDVVNSTEAIAERVPNARTDQAYALKRLAKAQEALADLQRRLDTSTRVLAATLAIQKEFFHVNGPRLAKLRKLSVRPRLGDKV